MTRNKVIFYMGLIFIVLYLSPYYILGEDSRVRIHDNLDSNIVWNKLMAESHTLFGGPHSSVPNIMNGLPRNSLGSEFDFFVFMFSFLSPFAAYVLNQTILRFVAFFGMYVLLKRHVLFNKENYGLIVGVAVTYALLPYWPSMGLSIAGLPLALYCFMNIKQYKASKWDWIILALLPFYSSFVLSFSFFIGCLGIWWLIDALQHKKLNWGWLIALGMMTFLFLAVNYRIIDEMFIQTGFTSHRAAFSRGHLPDEELFRRALHYFTKGQTHVDRQTAFIVLPVILFALGASLFKRKLLPTLWLILGLNFLFSYCIAYYYSEKVWHLSETFKLITTFNFGRIHFLEPLLWYVGFAIALAFLCQHFRKGKAYAFTFLFLQILLLFSFNEQSKYTYYEYPTYREFYSASLFNEIKRYIGSEPSSYRVVSIGMHPSIAQYNGFYTLDGYVVSYPLSYKKQFRKIIAPELEKSGSLRRYYDNWGSRCYLFVSELGKHYLYTKDHHKVIHHLDINAQALKALGGDYILSAVKIENASANALTFEKSFENQNSPWKIFLYKVNA
ncbi:hypothetical protein JOD43_000517 [Pullulanibacillus pueri]|uniref:Putative membrane protein YkoS n=1 Tax=Pullulanibacillus pueri TaxID=1437324 RepID=A0A8J2ZTB9_9BACL|nr:DUF6044 family protein [Pullulanibacillus pueri]MBM7680358.1 hypothetical protein [Pullulanibacillus pueri]GGH75471.1 putative membrane protein YkoS [Pullulanibacillus pueri]